MTQCPMPQYQCHKKVWALKIKAIERLTPTIEDLEKILNAPEGEPPVEHILAIITPEDPGFAPFGVTSDYVHKHDPQPGGYFVVYEDGYKSFSPGKAFEGGYTRIV